MMMGRSTLDGHLLDDLLAERARLGRGADQAWSVRALSHDIGARPMPSGPGSTSPRLRLPGAGIRRSGSRSRLDGRVVDEQPRN